MNKKVKATYILKRMAYLAFGKLSQFVLTILSLCCKTPLKLKLSLLTKALFRFKIFYLKLLHRILRHMYRALNVDEKN
jgi:hypothetical protein